MVIEDDSMVLCEGKNTHVEARISGGCLTISGQELGAAVKEIFHGSDYEYWCQFDRENTEKLFYTLSDEAAAAKQILVDRFGSSGMNALRELCEEYGIKYTVFSY